MQMVMNSGEILADWPMSHAKRVKKDNRKNPEYRVLTISHMEKTIGKTIE